MPIAYTVLYEGQELGSSKDGFTFTEVRLYESADMTAAYSEGPFYGDAHDTLPGAYVQSVSVKPSGSFEEGTGKTLKTIQWGPKERQQRQTPNQYGETWEWQMMAQTKHVSSVPATGDAKEALVAEWRLLAFENDPAKNGDLIDDAMIGKDEKGKYAGCEIYRPTGALRVSKEFRNGSDVNRAYRRMLYQNQSKTNASEWIDWDAGEIMFVGASVRIGTATATTNNQPTVTVDFSFIFGRTQDGQKFKIHSAEYDRSLHEVEVAAVRPFEYLWMEPYTKTVYPQGLTGEHAITEAFPGPLNVKLAKMYSECDFADFGLVGPGV